MNAPGLLINTNGTIHFDGGILNVQNLTLVGGGKMNLAERASSGGNNRPLYLNTLLIDSQSTLDMNDNDLVVNSGDFSTIQNLVFAGYRDYIDTTVTGIVSSTSQATGGNTILALFDNALVGRTDWSAGSGQTISSRHRRRQVHLLRRYQPRRTGHRR